jgi:Cys-tRNA(Pro)/Cys-tRNA(Cys) deacylase
VLRYHHDPRAESYGEEAVDELAAVEADTNIVAEQVFKTLIIAVPKGLAVAVLAVPAKLSPKAAAAALRVPKAAADRRRLGPPLGQGACSAGKRGWDVAVHPQDLIRLTDAVTADIKA